MATNENEGPTAEIVGKKTFGSVDFRQSWRTRLLFYRDVIHQSTLHWQGLPTKRLWGWSADGVLSRAWRLDFRGEEGNTAFASHPCDRAEISGR
jgi:hypothetical protein